MAQLASHSGSESARPPQSPFNRCFGICSLTPAETSTGPGLDGGRDLGYTSRVLEPAAKEGPTEEAPKLQWGARITRVGGSLLNPDC